MSSLLLIKINPPPDPCPSESDKSYFAQFTLLQFEWNQWFNKYNQFFL